MSIPSRNVASLVPPTYRSILKATNATCIRSIAMLEMELGLQPLLSSLALQLCPRRTNASQESKPIDRVDEISPVKQDEEPAQKQRLTFLFESVNEQTTWKKLLAKHILAIYKSALRSPHSLRHAEKHAPEVFFANKRMQSLLWLTKHLSEITQLNLSLVNEIAKGTDRKLHRWPINVSSKYCYHFPQLESLRKALETDISHSLQAPQPSGAHLEDTRAAYVADSFLPIKPKRFVKTYPFPFEKLFCHGHGERIITFVSPGYYFVPREHHWRHCIHSRRCELVPLAAFHKLTCSHGEVHRHNFQYYVHHRTNGLDTHFNLTKATHKDHAKSYFAGIDYGFQSILNGIESGGKNYPLSGLRVILEGKTLPRAQQAMSERFRVSLQCDMLWNGDHRSDRPCEVPPFHSNLVSLSLDEFHLFAYDADGETIQHILNCGPSGPAPVLTRTRTHTSFDVTFASPEKTAVVRGLLKLTAVLRHRPECSERFQIAKQRSMYVVDDAAKPRSTKQIRSVDNVPLYIFPLYANVGPLVVR